MSPWSRRLWYVAVVLVFILGIVLRTVPMAGFEGVGFDENLYRTYTAELLKQGILNYPGMVDEYIEYQKTLTGSILPPMRFLYIGTTGLWCWLNDIDPSMWRFSAAVLNALHEVASFFSILTLGVVFGFMWRLAGRGAALAVLAMMVCAPTQIHMGQHALVDGFFTFWATLTLWLLWENLQKPSCPWLLAGYGLSFALMVTTKENSAFVFIAIVALLIANRWARFGSVNRPLIWATLLGPAAGVSILVALAGGLEPFFTCYLLSVSKNFTLESAIKTGDGPWYRYLVDLMLVSPLTLILAIGAFFQLDRERHRPQIYVTLFIAASYLIMCNLKYGMNLRYANMWDAPLRLLAFTQLGLLVDRFALKPRTLWLIVAVIALCAYDFRQYWILAMQYDKLYELSPEVLLRALNILK